MTVAGWAEIVLYLLILTAITPPLGAYIAAVYRGNVRLGPVERVLRGAAGREQNWKSYARSVLVFSALSWLLLYLILRTQGLHPFNPLGLPSGSYDNSFNVASSFVTNTNWQYYAGETTMSYFSQMAGLTVQNFVSAGVGMAVLAAFIRALAARSAASIGNFYVDLTRSCVYVLLPISVILGLFLVWQGVPQTLGAGPHGIAVGPVAAQEAIKELGTNGGGIFNVNSAHPFENPNWVTNFVEMLAILAIPAALTSTYGRMVGNKRQGWAIFGAMMALFVVFVVIAYVGETHPTPAMKAAGIHGVNMEGKEQRFGAASSALWVAVTTAASCGAVNAAHEALSGLGAITPLSQMMSGEVIWGGVGSGLYGMLLFAILAVFISGLMVGRTPEFLGKKIEAREVKLTVFGTIGVPMIVLLATGLALTKWGLVSIYDKPGPQGFAETLYAYTSQANNNGSAFAGYTGYVQPNGTNAGAFGITFADILGGLTMIGGRFLPILAVLAVAGSLSAKRVHPPSVGTLRTDTTTFVVVLVGVVLLVALLTFVPALLLGPVDQALTNHLY